MAAVALRTSGSPIGSVGKATSHDSAHELRQFGGQPYAAQRADHRDEEVHQNGQQKRHRPRARTRREFGENEKSA